MKASIVIINYNDRIRVTRAIESALNQTYKDYEVILVDDGSNVETLQAYEPYSGQIKIVGLKRNDLTARTPSRARNEGIKHASGDYIYFLDSDNYISSTFLEDMLKDDADVLFCDWEIVGLQNYKIEINEVYEPSVSLLNNYLAKTHMDHQCLLIKREYLDKVGHYDTRLPRSQDCDLIVRLMQGGGSWCHIPKCLFHFETHEIDQMKTIASIHGKTLWSLKNGIGIRWLLGMAQRHNHILYAILQGFNDFMTDPKWADEKIKVEKDYNDFLSILKGERKENV